MVHDVKDPAALISPRVNPAFTVVAAVNPRPPQPPVSLNADADQQQRDSS